MLGSLPLSSQLIILLTIGKNDYIRVVRLVGWWHADILHYSADLSSAFGSVQKNLNIRYSKCVEIIPCVFMIILLLERPKSYVNLVIGMCVFIISDVID